MMIRVDYHPNFQQIAFLVEETGECSERRLNHSDGEAEKFCRDLLSFLSAEFAVKRNHYTVFVFAIFGVMAATQNKGLLLWGISRRFLGCASAQANFATGRRVIRRRG
jgi:hypothetical protein